MSAARTSPPGRRLDSREILQLSVWFALCTALGEVTLRTVQRHVLEQKISLSAHYVWMIPVALIGLFLVAALVLAGLSRVMSRVRNPAVPVAVFTFLVLIGPLLTLGRLHQGAVILLAGGVSAAIGRLAGARIGRLLTVTRRTLPVLAGLTVLVPTVALGSASWRERSERLDLAEATAGAPNVLLIILDTVRARNLEAYGYPLETMPNLARLAREGAIFLNAWSTSPWTLPAHGSLFTGRYEHELSTDLLTPLDDTYPTLAEHFRDRGYLTAGFAANLLFTTPESGLTRGFNHYEAYPVSLSMVAYSALVTRRVAAYLHKLLGSNQKLVRKHADAVTDAFLAWVTGTGERPFFVFLNYFDAHAPYLPPDSLSGVFGPSRTGKAMHDLSVRRDWTEAELRAEEAEYDGTLAYLDAELGRPFRGLAARGLADSTLVVVSADHGEQFGEHGGLTDHGNSMYGELLHVPLIIRFPGHVPPGTRVTEAVTLRDLAATLVDLTGQTPAPFPGTSLAPLAAGGHTNPSPVLAEVREGIRTPLWLPLAEGPMASVVADGFQYIRNGDGREELYFLRDDPDATRDLAASPTHRTVLEQLRHRTDTLRGDRPPRPPASGHAGSSP